MGKGAISGLKLHCITLHSWFSFVQYVLNYSVLLLRWPNTVFPVHSVSKHYLKTTYL